MGTPDPAVCVVMASRGYPGNYETGQVIRGLDAAARVPDVKVFHASTATSTVRLLPMADVCCGSPRWARAISAAKLKPTRRSRRSAGKAPGAARISLTKR